MLPAKEIINHPVVQVIRYYEVSKFTDWRMMPYRVKCLGEVPAYGRQTIPERGVVRSRGPLKFWWHQPYL